MIKALTILELVVVGLITAIVISVGYNGVLMIQKVNARKQEMHLQVASVEHLNQMIKYYMWDSDSIFWDAEKERLNFKNEALELSTDVVFFQSGMSDTLMIDIIGKEVTELELNNGSRVVESIRVTVNIDSTEQIIYGRKNYSNYYKYGLGS